MWAGAGDGMGGAKLILLGTGNPNPDPSSSGPASSVVIGDTAYLIDAGPGVVRQAAKAYQNGIEPLRADRLEHLFLTHLHSDHTLGLPDLMLTPWVMERKEPLKIWGPRGTRKMCKRILKAYEEDIQARISGLEKANRTGYKFEVNEIEEGTVLQNGDIKVDAFRVKHGIWKDAFGFRFEAGDRTMVISGDCSPTEALWKNYTGADILLHEVYSAKGFEGRSGHWKEYHRNSHTSSSELAKIACKVTPGVLVLYHQLLWGASPEDVVQEITETYLGEVRFGRDLEIY